MLLGYASRAIPVSASGLTRPQLFMKRIFRIQPQIGGYLFISPTHIPEITLKLKIHTKKSRICIRFVKKKLKFKENIKLKININIPTSIEFATLNSSESLFI